MTTVLDRLDERRKLASGKNKYTLVEIGELGALIDAARAAKDCIDHYEGKDVVGKTGLFLAGVLKSALAPLMEDIK